jgi:proteasome lid subunit RPN8/RPN11
VIVIRRAALSAILAHAREAAPRECCGVLIADGTVIIEAIASPNLSPDPNQFLLDPVVHIHARRRARTLGLAVAGFYHSHPRSAASPSPADLAGASYPDLLYLIVGLGAGPPDVGLFELVDGNFRRIEFVTGT